MHHVRYKVIHHVQTGLESCTHVQTGRYTAHAEICCCDLSTSCCAVLWHACIPLVACFVPTGGLLFLCPLISLLCMAGLLSKEEQKLSDLLMADWVGMHAQQPWLHPSLLQQAKQVSFM